MDDSLHNTYLQLLSCVTTNQRLYDMGEPCIPDAIYDQLFQQLRGIELRNPSWIDPESPTQKVAHGWLAHGSSKQPHAVRMLSLANATEVQDLQTFLNRTDRGTYSVEPKYDGLSFELIYTFGTLIRALTRGNGIVGEDFYDNAIKIQGIPKKIPVVDNVIAFHGEVVIPLEALERINQIKITRGARPYANARGAAVGILTGDGEFAHELHFILWDIPMLPGEGAAIFSDTFSHYERMRWGRMLRIGMTKPEPPVDYVDVAARIEQHTMLRETSPYQLDGVVVKLNDVLDRLSYKTVGKFPRWAVAWKFAAKGELTTVKDVIFEISPLGSFTPVVIVEPVTIDGILIQRVNLSNQAILKSMNLWIGDRVKVIRAMDVHNQISDILYDERPKDATMPIYPTVCPSCHTALLPNANRPDVLECKNHFGCLEQVAARISRYLGPTGLQISMQKAVVRSLVRDGHLESIADLYELKVEDLTKYRVGEVRAKSIIDSIASELTFTKREVHLSLLGIPGIHLSKAELFLNSMDMVRLAEIATSTGGQEILSGIAGPYAAEKIVEYCKNPRGCEILTRIGRLLQD